MKRRSCAALCFVFFPFLCCWHTLSHENTHLCLCGFPWHSRTQFSLSPIPPLPTPPHIHEVRIWVAQRTEVSSACDLSRRSVEAGAGLRVRGDAVRYGMVGTRTIFNNFFAELQVDVCVCASMCTYIYTYIYVFGLIYRYIYR